MIVCDFCGSKVEEYFKVILARHYLQYGNAFGPLPQQSCQGCIGRALSAYSDLEDSDGVTSQEVVVQFVKKEDQNE